HAVILSPTGPRELPINRLVDGVRNGNFMAGEQIASGRRPKGALMSIRSGFVVLCASVALAGACQCRESLPASPSVSHPGRQTSSVAAARFAAATDQGKTVRLMDACDPDTFNAPPPVGVGPGTCSRSGGVQFANFIDQLTRHHSIGAWH